MKNWNKRHIGSRILKNIRLICWSKKSMTWKSSGFGSSAWWNRKHGDARRRRRNWREDVLMRGTWLRRKPERRSTRSRAIWLQRRQRSCRRPSCSRKHWRENTSQPKRLQDLQHRDSSTEAATWKGQEKKQGRGNRCLLKNGKGQLLKRSRQWECARKRKNNWGNRKSAKKNRRSSESKSSRQLLM